MIYVIAKLSGQDRDINYDTLGVDLESVRANFCVVQKAFTYHCEPKESCYINLFFAPWHISRCICSYKEKKITLPESKEEKRLREMWHLCLPGGSILDGSDILVSIFDSNYSSWFSPFFHLTDDYVKLRQWCIWTFGSRYHPPPSLPAPLQGICEKRAHTHSFPSSSLLKGVKYFRSHQDPPSPPLT